MNKWLILTFLSLLTSAFADKIQPEVQQKIYFQQENVILQNNQILIGHGNHWAPVPQLFADVNGLYISVPQDSASLFQWECERCGWENWIWEDRCEACNHRRR